MNRLGVDDESVLPLFMNESGKDTDPIDDLIFCGSISGGNEYQDNMPIHLTLVRRLANGTEYRMEYTQVTDYED